METANNGLQHRIREFVLDSLQLPPPAATPRRVRSPHQLPNKATAVIGMRRAGKTTFLHQVRAERVAAGGSLRQLPFWNFEDQRLSGLTAAELPRLLAEFHRQQPAEGQVGRGILCLDEIQLVPGWERFVRRLLDTEPIDVFVSGSSAALLSREVATSMRGRGWEVVIHPFGFVEALAHAGVDVPDPEALGARKRAAMEHALLRWLGTGGFPEAQRLEAATRFRLLHDYVDVVMLRDVLERHQATTIAPLRWLVRHLLGNAGSRFSVQKFFDTLKSQGLRVGKDSLHDLLDHLVDCFLVRTVWLETDSEQRRRVNPRKVYPVDQGLIPVFDRSGKANLGHALETAVMIELERRGAQVTYVLTKDGHEVDFLARVPGGKTELIQVTADARDPTTAAREFRALLAAKAEIGVKSARLIALTSDSLPERVPRGVRATGAAEWFLGAE